MFGLGEDDFQLTSNQKSVWVMTVTICPPKGMAASPRYTFPISIGKKGADHSSVLSAFFNEIEGLRHVREMYSSKERRFIPCIGDISVYLGDHPERASFTDTLSFNSNIA